MGNAHVGATNHGRVFNKDEGGSLESPDAVGAFGWLVIAIAATGTTLPQHHEAQSQAQTVGSTYVFLKTRVGRSRYELTRI
jgi:hypothetical protein